MTDLLSGNLPPVPLRDQIRCILRELALRRRVYPAWVEKGRMQPATADEEIRRMAAVLETLQKVNALVGEDEHEHREHD